MPEVKYLLELSKEESAMILESFSMTQQYNALFPYDQKAVAALCARLVALTSGTRVCEPAHWSRSEEHGPNDTPQQGEISPYSAEEWRNEGIK